MAAAAMPLGLLGGPARDAVHGDFGTLCAR